MSEFTQSVGSHRISVINPTDISILSLTACLQDLLLLVALNSDNRVVLSRVPDWPEWLLQILLDNLEVRGIMFTGDELTAVVIAGVVRERVSECLSE